jgi:hypothetical protein
VHVLSDKNLEIKPMRLSAHLTLLLAVLAVGCATGSAPPAAPPTAPVAPAASTPARPKIYTQAEKTLLTYCEGLTDTAWNIAIRKVAGIKKEQVAAYYAKQPNTELTSAAIEKVYGDTFTYPWDYSVSFFQECALNIAHIQPKASELGAYCMQNSMLSGLAQEHKAAGKTREQTYELLPLKGDTPRQMVDAVYAKPQTRAVAMMAAWDDCMAPITGP